MNTSCESRGFGLRRAINQVESGSIPMKIASRALACSSPGDTSLMRALTAAPNAGQVTRRPIAAILLHQAAC